jgi:predicted transcriptional regulator
VGAPLRVEAKAPAVPIRKSITPDFLICLEDGKRFKSLRRHLSQLGLTPEQYRAKWNLPSDYPWSRLTTPRGDPHWRRK